MVLYALWGAALAAAHLFAGLCLLQLLRRSRPDWFTALQQAFARRKHAPEPAVTQVPGTAAAPADLPDVRVLRKASTAVVPVRIDLEWRNLGCAVRKPGASKQAGPQQQPNNVVHVLRGVWGRAQQGEMQALVGPSGAGKSTLMDLLAKRKNVGILSGQLLVNGRPVTRSFIKSTAYVPQEDTFAPVMTAEESLMFTANLALPCWMSKADRQQRVRDVLAVLGLSGASATMVGGALPGGLNLRGLSGGERKRLAVAAGILSSPSVLLLDEPTSGLDASAALTVMRYLRAMASVAGQIVIASIHQPRSAIWCLFDTATVLSAGRMMYHGPTSALVPWFSDALATAPYDPALHGCACDWVLDLVSVRPAGLKGGTGCAGADGDTGAETTVAADGVPLGATPSSLNAASERFLERYLDGPPLECTPAPSTQLALSCAQQAASAQDAGGGVSSGSSALSSPAPGAVQRRATRKVTFACGAQPEPDSSPQPGSLILEPSSEAVSRRASGVHGAGSAVKPRPRVTWAPIPGGSSSETSADEEAGRSQSGDKDVSVAPNTRKVTPWVWSSGQEDDDEDEPNLDQGQSHSHGPLGHMQSDASSSDADAAGVAAHGAAATAAWLAPAEVKQAKRRKPAAAGLQKQWQSLRTLLWREVVVMTRNPADVAGRTLTFAWVGLVVGLVYFSLPEGVAAGSLPRGGAPPGSATDALSAVQLRLNTIFSNAAFYMLMPYVSMSLYTADRRYFLAEVSSKLYKPGSFYVAKLLATLPFNAASAAVYSLVVYGMSGLKAEATAVVLNAVLSVLLSLIAVQVLHLAATLAPNQDLAFACCIAWTALNLLLSNFFIKFDEMAMQWLTKLHWISAMGFGVQGMAQVELQGRVFDCSGGASNSTISMLPRILPNTTLLQSPLVTNTLLRPGASCTVHADAMLEPLGLNRPISETIGILIGYLVIAHILTFVALTHVARRAETR